MEIVLIPLKMMGAVFLPFPFLAVVPTLLFAWLFYERKKPFLLVTSIFWGAYLVDELLMKYKLICSGECNIRVDLIFIYPILLIATLVAIFIALPSKVDHSAIPTTEQEPAHSKGLVVGLWIVATYLVLTSGLKIFSNLFIYSAAAAVSKPMVIFSIVLLMLNFAAGILLSLHKKSAFYILALAVTLQFISLAFNVSSMRAAAPGISLFQYLIPSVLPAAVLLFVFVLYKKRILCR